MAIHRRRGSECRDGCRERVEGDGRRDPRIDHLLRHGAERQLRAEPEHRHAVGADRHHEDHELHTHDRFESAGVAGLRPDAAAAGAGRAGTDARQLQSEHHARAEQLDAAARDLDHAVGIPERRGRQQRHDASDRQVICGLLVAGNEGALGTGLCRYRLCQPRRPCGESRDPRRPSDSRRHARRSRILRLQEPGRRPGA